MQIIAGADFEWWNFRFMLFFFIELHSTFDRTKYHAKQTYSIEDTYRQGENWIGVV